jgi:hypothetical protein
MNSAETANRTMVSTNNLIYISEFNDGYGFRGVMELLSAISPTANLTFSNEYIEYCYTDIQNTITIEYRIRAVSLCNYKYNSDKPTHMVGMKFDELVSKFKQCNKKDRIRLYQIDKHPNSDLPYNFTLVQIIGANSQGGSENVAPVNIQMNVPIISKHNLQKITTIDNHCITIPLNDFCKSCKALKQDKPSNVIINIFKRAIKFDGMQGNASISKQSFDNDCVDPKPLRTITVSTGLFKYFAKINTVANPGAVEFYATPRKSGERNFIQAIIRTGVYGKLRITFWHNENASAASSGNESD